MTHPTDDAVVFGAVTLGLPSADLTSWLASHPEVDRDMLLVAVPHDMHHLAFEWRTLPGTLASAGIGGLRHIWGHRIDGIADSAAFLFKEAPLEGLVSRLNWDATGEAPTGEFVFESVLSARGVGLALDRIAPQVPSAVRTFIDALATFDGHIGLGWRLDQAGPTHTVLARRILFAGTDACATIASAVGRMMAATLSDLETGAAWAAFAASTIPKLRPGDNPQGLDIRVVTDTAGRVDAVELDFFRIPTKLGVSLVQSFNLPTDKLELLGNLQGALGVEPSTGGVTWVDRARMSYARTGLEIEFGFIRRD